MDKAGFTFLITDLGLAMTLTRIASDALAGSGKRTRNQANARRAYEAISGISQHAFLSDDEREDVDRKLAQLKSALEMLGEVFP